MTVHPNYRCQCQAPNPLKHLGEDTGLCSGCTLIYDERLYEMRVRQHVPNYTYENLDDFLRATNPSYPVVV